VFLLEDTQVCEGNGGWNFVATTVGCNIENKFGLYDMTCHFENRALFLANVD